MLINLAIWFVHYLASKCACMLASTFVCRGVGHLKHDALSSHFWYICMPDNMPCYVNPSSLELRLTFNVYVTISRWSLMHGLTRRFLLYASSAHSCTKAVEKKINRDTNLVWISLYELESANHL